MRFKSVEVLGNRVDFEKQICFISGIDSDDYLDAMRELMFDFDYSMRRVTKITTAEIEINGRAFQARHAANVILKITPEKRVESEFAINYALKNGSYSAEETGEYMRLCHKAPKNGPNVLDCTRKADDGYLLSESDRQLFDLMKFIEKLSVATKRGDMRPIFVYGLFDRVDEAVDVEPYIKALASLGRQVFISTCRFVEGSLNIEGTQFADVDVFFEQGLEEAEEDEIFEAFGDDELPF